MHPDEPKSLRMPDVRAALVALLAGGHMAPLTKLVRTLITEMGPEYAIPMFDPMDGGIHADCLFLLEAPGAKAVATGFVSRNNPDETAKNFFLLCNEAGIERRRSVVWNIVPWYIGSGTKIRPANAADLRAAGVALTRLIVLLPNLHTIVLVGAKAASASSAIEALLPSARIRTIPHPSPMFVNRAPGNRALILERLREVANELPSRRAA